MSRNPLHLLTTTLFARAEGAQKGLHNDLVVIVVCDRLHGDGGRFGSRHLPISLMKIYWQSRDSCFLSNYLLFSQHSQDLPTTSIEIKTQTSTKDSKRLNRTLKDHEPTRREMADGRSSARTGSMSRAQGGQNAQIAIQPAVPLATTCIAGRPGSARTRSMSRLAQGQNAQQTSIANRPAVPAAATNVTSRQACTTPRANGRHTRGKEVSQSVSVIVPAAPQVAVNPPTPMTPQNRRRSSTWQLNRLAREGEEEAQNSAPAVQVAPQIDATPSALAIPQNPRPSSRRSRSPPTLRPPYRARETPVLKVVTTPTTSGPVLPTPPSMIKDSVSAAAPSNPASSNPTLPGPTPSNPNRQPSPVEEINTLAASYIQVGIDEWVASEHRRQTAADAAALENVGMVQTQVENPFLQPRIPVQGSTTVEPTGVLDSQWLEGQMDPSTDEDSRHRIAQPGDVAEIFGRGLIITDAYHADQEMTDVLPSNVLTGSPEDIWDYFQEDFEETVPTPETLTLIQDLYLPFGAQTQAASAPPAPSGAVPSHYDTSSLCVDETCPIRHSHEQGMYHARAELPGTWHESWGYSDPPQEIWEAWTAIALGAATDQQGAMVHGFAECHFWPGPE